jgi:TctA family transporter
MILGGIMEPALRRSLIMSDGSFMIFFNHSPITRGLTIVTLLLFISPLALKLIRRKRKTAGPDLSSHP